MKFFFGPVLAGSPMWHTQIKSENVLLKHKLRVIAAKPFLTDRVGPGRFIICYLSRSDFFRWRWFWVAAVRWIRGSKFWIVRAQPTLLPTELLSIRWVYHSLFNSVIMLNAILSIARSSHQGHERFSEISRGRHCSFMSFSALLCAQSFPVQHWDTAAVDQILIEGDRMYLNALESQRIPDTDTLSRWKS